MVVTLGVLVVAAACSSGGGPTAAVRPTTTSPPSAPSPTYTVGVLVDNTGLASSSYKTFTQGVEAGIRVAAQQGINIKFVVADTTSLPGGALSAAQALVEQDHVFAVLAGSALLYSASDFLTAHGVPVLGAASDGPEWLHASNMFSAYGRPDPTKVAETIGLFMKMQGVSDIGTVGYSISPLSAESAKSEAASAEAVGLKAGYVNPGFPFGSTNVVPAALAMKSAKVDGVFAAVSPSTALALVTALRQEGVAVKAAVLPTGYGGDLLQGGPGTVQDAQGAYFQLEFQPIELHTAATEQFAQALRNAGVTTDPTYAQYVGYVSVGLLIRGLQLTGPSPTQSAFINALSGVKDWNAMGLLGDHKVDLSLSGTNVLGPDNCLYMTKLVGTTFTLVQNAEPICGATVPGKTVSSS